MVLSVLVLEELMGALASATLLPAEKTPEVEANLIRIVGPVILPFEECVEKTTSYCFNSGKLRGRREYRHRIFIISPQPYRRSVTFSDYG